MSAVFNGLPRRYAPRNDEGREAFARNDDGICHPILSLSSSNGRRGKGIFYSASPVEGEEIVCCILSCHERGTSELRHLQYF